MMDELRCMVGLADACELASITFAFPGEALASALASGSYGQDAASCLADAGVFEAAGALLPLEGLVGIGSADLLDAMRKGHSILYLGSGAEVPVWPYEAGFRHVSDQREGELYLFRAPATVDVDRHMREAGVLPKDARREPIDSVWNEFSFMSYLYGNVAKALHEGREADAAEWSGRIARFWDEHSSKWMPAFMEKTIEEAPRHSYGAEYAVLAEVGLTILKAISDDVERRR